MYSCWLTEQKLCLIDNFLTGGMRGAIDQVFTQRKIIKCQERYVPDWMVCEPRITAQQSYFLYAGETRLHQHVLHLDLAVLNLREWVDRVCVRIAHLCNVSNWVCVGDCSQMSMMLFGICSMCGFSYRE